MKIFQFYGALLEVYCVVCYSEVAISYASIQNAINNKRPCLLHTFSPTRDKVFPKGDWVGPKCLSLHYQTPSSCQAVPKLTCAFHPYSLEFHRVNEVVQF